MDPQPRTTVVMTTRDRCSRVTETLPRLLELPDAPPVIVVDDASSDDTSAVVRARFPQVSVLRAPRNMGAAARNLGVAAAATPYVAFADDDSWWGPGALDAAADVLDRHGDVGLLAARTTVEPGGRDDPTNAAMATSPLRPAGLPGPEVLGFVACGAVVRREAFLGVGGFDERFLIGGEEELLALDLRTAGWRCVYVEQIRAHHQPDTSDARPGRQRRLARNDVWTAWLRRHPRSAAAVTLRRARGGIRDRAELLGVLEALGGLPAVLRDRRPVPEDVERDRRLVERAGT